MLSKNDELSEHSGRAVLETKVLALCFALPCNFLPYSSSLLNISIIYNLSF